MKLSEVKTSTNQQLIEALIATCFKANVSNQGTKLAKRICLELKKRRVIDDGIKLFKKWSEIDND